VFLRNVTFLPLRILETRVIISIKKKIYPISSKISYVKLEIQSLLYMQTEDILFNCQIR